MLGLGLRKRLRASFGSGSRRSKEESLNGEIFTFSIVFFICVTKCGVYFDFI